MLVLKRRKGGGTTDQCVCVCVDQRELTTAVKNPPATNTFVSVRPDVVLAMVLRVTNSARHARCPAGSLIFICLLPLSFVTDFSTNISSSLPFDGSDGYCFYTNKKHSDRQSI